MRLRHGGVRLLALLSGLGVGIGVGVAPAIAQVAAPAPAAAFASLPKNGVSAEDLASLHRVSATLETTLDTLRLAFLEVLPAIQQVADLGKSPTAATRTAVPRAAREVFERVARSVSTRVPSEALSPIARGYLSEVVDALEVLSVSPGLIDVLPILENLRLALRRLLAQADSVIDLFSRDRPLLTRVVDPATLIDDLAEALDALAAAERQIDVLRAQQGRGAGAANPAELGAQLDAFLRLEVSLGHVLDLIALADEAGVQIGFQLRRSTAGLESIAARLGEQLASLDALVEAMAKVPPPVLGGEAIVLGAAPETPERLRVSISWSVDAANPPPFVRITQVPNVALADARKRAAAVCGGSAPAPFDPRPVGILRSAQGSHADLLTDPTVLPARYQMVGLTPFGVESEAIEIDAPWIPEQLAPVTFTEAVHEPVEPWSARFYAEADRLEVRWGASLNDVSGDAALAAFARRMVRPTVRGYELLRHQGTATVSVARLAAGETSFVDRPSAAAFAEGVRYSVVVLGPNGEQVPPNEACPTSRPVRHDLAPDLELAAAGLANVSRPNELDRRTARALLEPAHAAEAAAARRGLDAAELERRARAFWQRVPEVERIAWRDTWSAESNPEELAQFFATPPAALRLRDGEWAVVSMWLAEQSEPLRSEHERYWKLLGDGQRLLAIRSWAAGLGRAEAARLGEGGGGEHADQLALEEPARLLTWWRSRHPTEQDIVWQWWIALTPDQQGAKLAHFYGTLPEARRHALRFPAWQRLTQGERAAWLSEGFADPDLPPPLGRLVHAAQSVDLGSHRADGLSGAASRLRFSLRSVDLALAGQLGTVGWLALLFGLAALSLWRVAAGRTLRGIPALDRLLALSQRLGSRQAPLTVSTGAAGLADPRTVAAAELGVEMSRVAHEVGSPAVLDTADGATDWLGRELGVATGLVGADGASWALASGAALRPNDGLLVIAGVSGEAGALVAERARLAGRQVVGAAADVDGAAALEGAAPGLIGEEVYVAPAYLAPTPGAARWLWAQDLARWLVVGVVLAGAVAALLGVDVTALVGER